MSFVSGNFLEPPWDAPLDVAGCLRQIPDSATVTGMFLEPLVEMARNKGVVLRSARDRYVPFRVYPMREHAALLVEACERLYPNLALRQALRKLGRGAPHALLRSTIGKITIGSASGVIDVLRAMSRAYPLNVHPSRVDVLEAVEGRAVVRIEQLHYFLDSHHVGAFESVLRFGGASSPRVLVCAYSPIDADLLCTWGRPSLRRSITP
ncbi:MAG: DUF2378 family protein [Polyangiales bacterium]